MTFDEAAANIGAPVTFKPSVGPPEMGVISSVNDDGRYVYVRFVTSIGGKGYVSATTPERLQLVP